MRNRYYFLTIYRRFTSKIRNMSNWQTEKQKYLSMTIEEKRSLFRKDVTEYKDIPTWLELWQKKNQNVKDDQITGVNKLAKKISIWSGDITSLEIDAIVNAANRSLLGGGGVDGAIHKGAGKWLKEESSNLAPCEVGQAKITGGYLLPAKYVIHTVGPRGEMPEKLKECYKNSLLLARNNGLRSIAFPCISTGIYGYPQREAAEVAFDTVEKYLRENLDDIDRVVFCLFLKSDQEIYEELLTKFFNLG